MNTVSDAGAKTVWRGSLNALIDDVQAVLQSTTDPVRAIEAAWVGYFVGASCAKEIAAEYAGDRLGVFQVMKDFGGKTRELYALMSEAYEYPIAQSARKRRSSRESTSTLDDFDTAGFVCHLREKWGTERHPYHWGAPFLTVLTKGYSLENGRYERLFYERVGTSNSYIEQVRAYQRSSPSYGTMSEVDLRRTLDGAAAPVALVGMERRRDYLLNASHRLEP